MPNSQKSGDRPGSPRTIAGLPMIRAQVAGIDIGSERHWVCARGLEGSGREVENFGATTAELVRMAEWLKERKVESVAMESTGVYWIAPHEVLEKDCEVLLVDTRQLARVPGRNKKTDPSDCEWIQRLHSCGLLNGSFRPQEQVCMLRTLGTRQSDSGSGIRGLGATDAEESGPDECAGASGGVGSERRDGDGDCARHRRRREGRPETSAIAGTDAVAKAKRRLPSS